jgi:hypothetical protein
MNEYDNPCGEIDINDPNHFHVYGCRVTINPYSVHLAIGVPWPPHMNITPEEWQYMQTRAVNTINYLLNEQLIDEKPKVVDIIAFDNR